MLARVSRHIPQRTYTNVANNEMKTRYRSLLRETAQPVVVVTSLLHPTDKSPDSFHGATLSSFSSIAMDPYPLVAFSLIIPSRMAASLRRALPETPSDMVVNILSAAQANTAVMFSRPDLHPHPFQEVEYTLNSEGIPIIGGSLGAVSCKLTTSPILLDSPVFSGRPVDSNTNGDLEFGKTRDENSHKPSSSELFIARVTNIEELPLDEVDVNDPRTMPLLYHRRSYATCSLENLVLGQKS
ncbi:flavin reductase like domain-containing protein [Lentinula raphanica]|uniref:Flavin reductase like domain-containing protein n=1 Tax=Lentinula raphanica TaxID=153919 RepID=A0AA38UGM9_9AGAR|nr:flavin reductase like domain-containing protein [Lentinula raphanica]KAJ3840421.1 flavin reductase like domain-containing protein [Lentinula raphanica]KAJ3971681.1 flavin reductase like domain-containing protein [Lentinula raphanica]